MVENSDIAWDIHQVVRQVLAWKHKNKELHSDKRDWSEMIECIFDDPVKCSTEPLPTIEVLTAYENPTKSKEIG
jgi:hypothetical protein